ncbi:MAG: hypothetical protein KAV69_00285 [Deltaproteobacteria bacterium]|nr:hypothetical protein [Deltaproteobacteria bacterium]
MFEILKDSEASVESLSRAYVEAMTFEKKLEGEKAEAHRALMIEQRDYLDPGTKPSKKLIAAKDRWQDTCNKIEAVPYGKGELKARIADRLGVDAKQRLEQITKELAAVSSEEKELREAFLSMAAKAAVLKEQIKGRSLLSDSQGRVTSGVPSLKVELHLLDGADGAFYARQIERFRQESGQDFSETIRGRRDTLVLERAELKESLQSNPAEEAQRLLDKLIPPPTPEPAEPESRKTSEFTIDYDKIGGPDYGEGEPLPYKGINEVLHDRANS